VLAEFVRREMAGVEIPLERFLAGEWVDVVPELPARPKVERRPLNGAREAAVFLDEVLGGTARIA
jgi:hypothetical protein